MANEEDRRLSCRRGNEQDREKKENDETSHEWSCLELEIGGVESVALAEIAGLISLAEPAGALLGSAVRECIRHDVSLRVALQGVVADGGRGPNSFIDVAGFHDVFDAIGVTSPDTGEEIRLQFQADREP